MKFVQIEGYRQNKIFCTDVFCASHKESFKSVILFCYFEHTLCLYGSVYPELNIFFWNDILSAFFSEIIESLTDLDLLGIIAFVTLAVIRTSFTGFTTVDLCNTCLSWKALLSLGTYKTQVSSAFTRVFNPSSFIRYFVAFSCSLASLFSIKPFQTKVYLFALASILDNMKWPHVCSNVDLPMIDRRYNWQGVIVFTSNKSPAQWKHNFSDDDDLLCALDKIFDDATVFNIRGDSYRGKQLENITLQTSRVSSSTTNN